MTDERVVVTREAKIEAYIIEGIKAGLKTPKDVAQKHNVKEKDVWAVFLQMVKDGKLKLEVV